MVLGFSVPPTAKVIHKWELGLKSHLKDLEKPGIKLTTPGFQGEQLFHYTIEASSFFRYFAVTVTILTL